MNRMNKTNIVNIINKIRARKNFRFSRFSRLDLAMLIGAVFAIIISSFTTFAQTCEEMPNDVLRLHILANSNSDEDQKLKYEVRDYLLKTFSEIFSNCENLNQAVLNAEKNQALIQQKAQEFVMNKGYNYEVNCKLTRMYFTTRVYEKITMPAGYYEAVRITIGSGEGKNWWCVMFPPLCVPAASNEEFFTDEQSEVIENGGEVEVKFAIFEFFQGLFGGSDDDSQKSQAKLSEMSIENMVI